MGAENKRLKHIVADQTLDIQALNILSQESTNARVLEEEGCRYLSLLRTFSKEYIFASRDQSSVYDYKKRIIPN